MSKPTLRKFKRTKSQTTSTKTSMNEMTLDEMFNAFMIVLKSLKHLHQELSVIITTTLIILKSLLVKI
jgi:hypothetical protein